jgi:hypothetical protein
MTLTSTSVTEHIASPGREAYFMDSFYKVVGHLNAEDICISSTKQNNPLYRSTIT